MMPAPRDNSEAKKPVVTSTSPTVMTLPLPAAVCAALEPAFRVLKPDYKEECQ